MLRGTLKEAAVSTPKILLSRDGPPVEESESRSIVIPCTSALSQVSIMSGGSRTPQNMHAETAKEVVKNLVAGSCYETSVLLSFTKLAMHRTATWKTPFDCLSSR
jgi:hypothetical protein